MRIPRLTTNPQQRTAVQRPTISPEVASAGSRGLAGLANQATDFLGQLAQKRKQAEQNDTIQQGKLNWNKSVYEKTKELKSTFKGDYKGYTDEVAKFVNKLESDILSTASDEDT